MDHGLLRRLSRRGSNLRAGGPSGPSAFFWCALLLALGAARPAAATAPEEPPRHAAGLALTPLVLYDAVSVEGTRLLSPRWSLTARAGADYADTRLLDQDRLGRFRLVRMEAALDVGFHPVRAAHGVGFADGPFVEAGVAVRRWDGRTWFRAGGSSPVRGTWLEPEVLVGWRWVVDGQFVVHPRAGLGWSREGAQFRDRGGERRVFGGSRGLQPRFRLAAGVLF